MRRVVVASHAPRSRRFAHRAHPLTSTPEHCAASPQAAYDRPAHGQVRPCPAGCAARARARGRARRCAAAMPRATERGSAGHRGRRGDGEVTAARGGTRAGRRTSVSASLMRGRRSSSRGSRSGSCASSSSARCWRRTAASASAGWRERRRWLRTCSPRRRRRHRRRRGTGPSVGDPGYALATRPVLARVEPRRRFAARARGRRPAVVRRALGARARVHRSAARGAAARAHPRHPAAGSHADP